MNSPVDTGDMNDKSEFSENLNIFRQIEFFSGLSIEVIKLFAFLCKRQTYKKGDVIFYQDDDDRCAYYVLDGRVQLMLEIEGENHMIRECGAENFFGVIALMSPMMKPLSLIAKEDATCLVMTREAFLKVVDQFPQVPQIIVKTLGQQVLKVDRKAIFEFESGKNDSLKPFLGISLL